MRSPSEEQQREAKSPHTSPARLTALAEESPALRALVLQNVSTPPALLDALAQDDPVHCLRALSHPNAPNSLYERLANSQKAQLRRLVAESPRVPRALLLRLRLDPNRAVQQAARRNRGAAAIDPPEDLPFSPQKEVRLALAREAQDPKALLQLSRDEALEVRLALAQREDLPDEVARALLRDASPEVRLAYAKRAPVATLDLLSRDLEPRVRQAVSSRTDLPGYLALRLSRDEAEEVRGALACNPAIRNDEIMEALAQDTSLTVRQGVALRASQAPLLYALARGPEGGALASSLVQNPVCPEDLLVQLLPLVPNSAWSLVNRRQALSTEALRALLRSTSPQAPMWRATLARTQPVSRAALAIFEDTAPPGPALWRQNLAANPKTTPEALEELAQDQERAVRAQVANHAQTPASTRRALSRDSDESVRAASAASADLSPEDRARLATETSQSVLARLAQNPSLSVEEMRALGAASARALAQLLARPDLPEALLDEWCSTSPLLVSRHPKVQQRHLETLATHPDARVRQEVAARLAPESPALRALARDSWQLARAVLAARTSLPAPILAELAGDADAQVRLVVARNRTAPEAALERLAADEDPSVVLAVARNTSAAPSALEILSQHPRESVRATTARHPRLTPALAARLAQDRAPLVRLGIFLRR